MVYGHETYRVRAGAKMAGSKWPKKGKKINPLPPKKLERADKFVITPYEHGHFKDWYNDLDPELRALLEKKGMPTEEFLEKLWVSGFRVGYDNAPRGEMRVGPPSYFL